MLGVVVRQWAHFSISDGSLSEATLHEAALLLNAAWWAPAPSGSRSKVGLSSSGS